MSQDSIHRQILDDMREGVMSLDPKGVITTFNAAAERILGLPRSEVLGQVLATAFLEREGTDAFVEAIFAAIYTSNTAHQERVSFPAHGTRRLLAVTTSFLHETDVDSGEQRRSGVVAVFSDITEVETLRENVRALEAFRVQQLVRAYRERGHVLASVDPLALPREKKHAELDPAHYGLDVDDSDAPLPYFVRGKAVRWPLGRILEHLQSVYCGPVGVQYMHIDDLEVQSWLRERLEDTAYDTALARDTQLHILGKLTDAEVFETFVQRTFQRSKRFSLEGAETLIPLLDQALERAATYGVEDVVIGMSHRGRLNVLVNLMDVPAHEIFQRFEQLESDDDATGPSDVRFHLGTNTTRTTTTGHRLNLDLCFNPSHLEFVSPVVLGRARARQDGRENKGTVLPLLVHGDAAFAGQGVIQEMFNLSRLAGYTTGGAVHVVLNNQIGFTTPPHQGRSTQYATDVARMLQIPIFHVNGERPEAVDRVIRLAMDFWNTWRRDVVVDMYCYRRRGHMEQDDPRFTQPELYRIIDECAPIRESYQTNLVALGQVGLEEAQAIATASQARLAEAYARATISTPTAIGHAPTTSPAPDATTKRAAGTEQLMTALETLSTLPEGFSAHPKISAICKRRKKLATSGGDVDWATAEILAMGTLLQDGHAVRFTGQDSERGTFGHRHAVLHDTVTGVQCVPLAALAAGRAHLSLHNSPLSETAVMAFEFGYSIDAPGDLVVWEAQFGDFANVAQVVIDQFLVSSEEKWGQRSGLCLLLPHGLEGQGPEHSSARIERFLQLCACENMTVVQPTRAAQIFHLLRAQAQAPTPRPLIVFAPKRLLQNKAAQSPFSSLVDGTFEALLVDATPEPPDRAIICSGQIAMDLVRTRDRLGVQAMIVRLEQLYPLPGRALRACLSRLPVDAPIAWVQEEPENMGAWTWLRPRLQEHTGRPVRCVARAPGTSPATGSAATHAKQQEALLERAFEAHVSSA